MFVMARLDYRRLRPLAVPLMGITIVLLVAVIVIGVEGGGARRWIGVGELTLQPAEFAKLTVIIYLAAWLASRGGSLRSFEHGLVPFVLIIGTVSALILLQPNLGTTLIILAITVTMFWVAGASLIQMVALLGSGLVAITVLALGAGYRAERVTAFLHAEKDPDGIGFQTLQALIAVGNGGVTGLGLGASRAKFFYLPESHTDGIFAIIGEELGLLAGLAILLLYVLLMIRGYQVARRARWKQPPPTSPPTRSPVGASCIVPMEPTSWSTVWAPISEMTEARPTRRLAIRTSAWSCDQRTNSASRRM
jgi:cell division protein FtsW